MTTSVVQSVSSGALAGASAGTLTFSATGVANTIVIECAVKSHSGPYTGFTLSDNAAGGSNTYVLRKKLNGSGAARIAAIYDCIGTVRSFTVLTVTGTGGSGGMFGIITAQEVSGIGAADQNGSAATPGGSNGTVTTTCGGSDTTAADFVAAAVSLGAGQTNCAVTDPPSGFTSAGVIVNDSVEAGSETCYRVNTTAVTDSAAWSWTGSDVLGNPAVIASYTAAAGAPAAPNIAQRGPGVMPGNAQNQFRAAPRAIILPAAPVTAMSGSLAAVSSFSADMSSLSTSGGLGFIPQPGPGVGPFSNNQFLAAPRAPIQGSQQALMSAQVGTQFSLSASFSQLQLFAAGVGSVFSVIADLTTISASGGAIGYLPVSGPGGTGPLNRNQFQAAPRSSNAPFQQLSGAATLTSQYSVSADIVNGISLTVTVGGIYSVGGTLSSGIPLAASLLAKTSLLPNLTTAIPVAALLGQVMAVSPSLTSGINLAASLQGVTSLTATLGSAQSFAASLAGNSSLTASLGSAQNFAAAVAGSSSLSGAMTTGLSMAAALAGASSVSAAATVSGAQCSAQLTASQALTPSLSNVILAAAQLGGASAITAALTTANTLAATLSGAQSLQAPLTTGIGLSATTGGVCSISASLVTVTGVLASSLQGRYTVSADLLTAGDFSATLAFNSYIKANLLTVLQPPGEFADVVWLRAPQSNPAGNAQALPYGEFYQRVGEKLWYAIVWEAWLSNRWKCNAAAILGQAIRPSVANGYQLVCTSAGQTGATEPTWPAYIGGAVMDGSAIWSVQVIDSASLEDTIQSTNWVAPTGIGLDSGQFLGLRTYVLIDTSGATVGTDYDVINAIVTTDGQQKIGKLRIKVR